MNPALQKFLALALAFLAFAGLIVLVPLPYMDLISGKQEQINNLEGTLNRYNSILERAQSYKNLDENGAGELQKFLLSSRTPSQAGAEIQGIFTDLSRNVGIAGGNYRPVQQEKEGPLNRVGFRVTFRTTTYSLTELLATIEKNRPLIILENVTITAPREQTPGVDPLLNVQMDVFGYQGDFNAS